ncbi:AMP-binding protein [Oceanispirochaeta sp.]|jgi:long-chain acyl-CoA synthetase|uniref:AMP-binding protein n=1 Tax=Oceanispirochaeta sp. TaxID=2035350 RepID=UPI0026209F19|nr:AMP-binding protein [Oceanispirochaeta sp.]MDA3956508.1 AMP-binding protein [Oceanispirochaeta sp.]
MPFLLKINTINEFHKEAVKRYEKRPFLYFVDDEPISYKEYGQQVAELRRKLVQQDLKKADAIVLLGPASPNWAISFMAVMSAGFVVVPVMEEFPDLDIDHIIENSGCAAVILAPPYVGKESLPALKNRTLISMDDFSIIKQGEQIKRDQHINPFTDRSDTLSLQADDQGCYPTDPSDVAELLYTSGTTGFSKAVMLTHNNLVTNLYEGTDLIDECFDENAILLSLLPLAHSFGSTSAFLSTMYKGPRICFLKRKPTPEYLQIVFQKVKPTILGGVPLIFEKIFQKKIVPLIESKSLLKKATTMSPLLRKGFYRIAGKSVMNYFGGRIKCIIIGGANFSEQVETFMKEARIPYLLGYGLSETSPLLTFSSLKESRFGSVGKAVRNTKIRISHCDESGIGDIEVLGPQVMKGYFRKEEETATVFCPDGWFKTGDRGILDGDGFLYIKGRSKNVIVRSSGENIYPEVIEIMLSSTLLIEESIVYLDDQQLSALIYPDQDLFFRDYDGDCQNEQLLKDMDALINQLNQKLPLFSRISKFEIQKSAFEKTATRKIKRGLYLSNY